MVASGFSSNHWLTRSLCSYIVYISGIIRSYLNTSRFRIAVLFAANRAGRARTDAKIDCWASPREISDRRGCRHDFRAARYPLVSALDARFNEQEHIRCITARHEQDHFFAALARSFGTDGTHIDGVEQLGGALCEAVAGGRPAHIECPMDRPPSPFQMRCGGGQGSPEPIVEFFYE